MPKQAHRAVPDRARGHAKSMRRAMSDAETRFWLAIRAHRFHGLGFRRQIPIAGYIIDFVCHERRLVVEIDGGDHAEDEKRISDTMRTRRLEAEGYRVIRFWNNDVMSNLEGVMQTLADTLGLDVPPSQPSPTRGEG